MSLSLQSKCTFIDEQPSIQLNCSNMQSKSEMISPSSLVWTAFPIIYMCDANGRCKYYHKCLETHFYKCSSHRAAAFYWLIHGRGSVAVASATLTHTRWAHTHTLHNRDQRHHPSTRLSSTVSHDASFDAIKQSIQSMLTKERWQGFRKKRCLLYLCSRPFPLLFTRTLPLDL